MRIQTRIIGAAMLVVLVVNVLYVLYVVNRERKEAITQLRASIAEHDRILKVVTAGPLYDGNMEQLDATLNSVFTDLDIIRIDLEEYSGNIRMYRSREPAAAIGDTVTSSTVITRRMDDLGEVRITYSTARIEQRLIDSRNRLLLFSGILLFGIAGVIFLAAKGLTGPIERLSAAARAMADGDLEQSIETSKARELRSLGQSFIRMRDAIRTKIADLAAQNETLRLKDMAMASSINGIAIADPQGLLTYVNASFIRMWGYDDESEVLGKSVVRIWRSEKDAAQVLAELRSGEGGIGELAARRKDGSFFDVEFSASVVRDRDGNILYFMGSFVDVTGRKKAEKDKAALQAQLLQAQKIESVGRLAGGVAHDFNNMLSVILGYVDLIKRRLSPGDPLTRDMLEIERAAVRSRDITRQLLAFSRQQIISPRPVNLNALIADTRNTLARLIGEDIMLSFHPGSGVWDINIDPSQLDQVLVNLAVNARDAMPDGGMLTVETANAHLDEDFCREHMGCTAGDYVVMTVTDTGIGMDSRILPHIFDPFFTTKDIGKGTGLGLATVYGIVKQNSGFIDVESAVGRGTTFRIYFPRLIGTHASEAKTEEVPASSGSETILVVEDDAMVRTLTTAMLQEMGYTILVANSPQEALALCRQDGTPIDLLITDVIMPEMKGPALREKVRALRPNIKVLYMSGYTSDVIVNHGVLEEGVNFIQKPFNMEDLGRKVHDVLSRSYA
jgi:PAS domain S-box-containing protein